jgi:uncharacterized protein YigA (DUF484 family)
MEKLNYKFNQGGNMKFGSEEVAQYLKQHPQFFDEYADMLADIYVPHPHGGRAIPISERQIVTLRDKNHILQDKLRELVKFGEENDVISEKMHRLSIMFLTFTHLNDFLNELNSILRDNFSVPHVALRLWNINCDSLEMSKFISTNTETHTVTNRLLHPYCGPQLADEIKSWFGESAAHLRSFSMIPLRIRQTIGVLVLASEEPQRFYPEMGTLYLQRLGDLVSTAISRYSQTECNK